MYSILYVCMYRFSIFRSALLSLFSKSVFQFFSFFVYLLVRSLQLFVLRIYISLFAVRRIHFISISLFHILSFWLSRIVCARCTRVIYCVAFMLLGEHCAGGGPKGSEKKVVNFCEIDDLLCNGATHFPLELLDAQYITYINNAWIVFNIL